MTAAAIDSHHLNELLGSSSPPQVIDVRSPGEFETTHIAGTLNVPTDLLQQHRDELVAHLTRDVVLVCHSGQRAMKAQESLRTSGFDHARVLVGGVSAWEAAGYTVNRGRQRWGLERQVRLVAGSIVMTSVLSSIAAPRLKWIAAAIGGGLTVASLTNTCAMGMALAKLPYNSSATPDARTVISQLAGSSVERKGQLTGQLD